MMFVVRTASVTAVLMIGSVATNIGLAVAFYYSRNTSAELTPLRAGEEVGQMTGVTLDGRSFTLGYEGEARPTLVYSFGKQCPWSRQNASLVRQLYERAGGRVRFIWASVDYAPVPPFEPSGDKGINIGPVLGTFAVGTVRQFSLGPTPQATVVSPGGKILGNWVGVWTTEVQEEIARALKDAVH